MKVLLLNPPTRDNKKFIREGRCTQEQGVWATLWPPISLAMIGAVLEKAGHGVRIVDCPAEGITWGGLKREIQALGPGLVIWSAGTPSIDSDLGLAGHIKQAAPGARTAVIGTHVSALARQCLERAPGLDCVVRNEPEETAAELARAVLQGREPEGVLGVTYRAESGEIISNPQRPFIENLESLPFPAWHLVDTAKYVLPMKARPFLSVAPQRGCPFSCSFCTCQTYYGSRLRKRSAGHVVSEIEHDIERFGVRDFFMWAETFVVDKDYVEGLCREILRRGHQIRWTCNSRVDRVDGDLLSLMRRAGCWMISFGIESASQQVLDRAEKGIKATDAVTAVRSAKRAGIKTAGHFIFGLPGETEQSMEDTIRFSKSLGLDIAQFYCCVPFPGSRLYARALEQGWISEGDFSGYGQGRAVMNLTALDPRAVDRSRARAYQRFYLNPAAWLRLSSLASFRGAGQAWRVARDFLHWFN